VNAAFAFAGIVGIRNFWPSALTSRTSDPNEYFLRINLNDRADVRRPCEVRVKGKDIYSRW
jgi:hypothetical protein